MTTSDAARTSGSASREGIRSSLARAEHSQSEVLAAPSSRLGWLGRLFGRLRRRMLRFHLLPQAGFNEASLDALRSVEELLARLEESELRSILERLGNIERHLTDLSKDSARQESLRESEIQSIVERIGNIERHLTAFSKDIEADFAMLRASVNAQGRQVDEVSGELVSATADIEKVEDEWEAAQAHATKVEEGFRARIRTLEKRLEPLRSMDHFDFARRYRGDPDVIRERLRKYAQVFGEVERVLDFGCGRGEFLEVCGEMNIGAYGVDSDPDMVSHCHLRRVDAKLGDAMEHVRKLPSRYLDGFFSAQVVEHLTPAELVELIQLLSTRIRRGGRLVIETINPDTFAALRWFYLDPTHCQPVPAELLRFLLEEASFRVLDVIMASPVPDEERLAYLAGASQDPALKDLVRIADQNLQRLNEVIFGPQDYAIVAER